MRTFLILLAAIPGPAASAAGDTADAATRPSQEPAATRPEPAVGEPPGGPLRVGGIVQHEVEWSGHVLITRPTELHARVTVRPGTIIEFAGAGNDTGVALTVAPQMKKAALLLKGTAEAPIIVRTRAPSAPGVISASAGSRLPIVWRHVRFEGLGYQRPLDSLQADVRAGPAFEPALSFVIDDGGSVSLESCTFARCARVFMRTSLTAAMSLKQCAFGQGVERTDFVAIGAGAGSLSVEECRFTGVVDVERMPLGFRRNVMVGPFTALSIHAAAERPAEVEDNLISNTAEVDDGRYCLKTRDLDARIVGNVLRGGTYVVVEGSRYMSHNVLMAAPSLQGVVRGARTHYLVAELPGRAVFEDNLLIGPAYSLLATQAARRVFHALDACPWREAKAVPLAEGGGGPPARGQGQAEAAPEPIDNVIIRRNVFDGLGNTGQAIRLNVLAREPVGAVIRENVFLRLTTLVMDESKREGVVRELAGNLVAPPAPRPFEGVVLTAPQQAGADGAVRSVESVSQTGLAAPLSAPPEDPSGAVLAGQTSIEQVRESLFRSYRPAE